MIYKKKAILITPSKKISGVQELRYNAYSKYFDVFTCNYKGSVTKWFNDAKSIFKNYYHKPFSCIIAEDLFLSGLIGVYLKKKYSVPLYIRSGGEWSYDNKFKNFIARIVKRIVISNYDLLLVNSKYLQNKIGGELYINGVDTDFYTPKKNLGIKHISFIGRLEESKGVKYFAKATYNLYREHFYIVGGGSLYSYLNNNTSEQSYILGKCDRKDVKSFLIKSKYIIVPTLESSCDSMPNVILEAMACGCIVICTDTEPNKGIIKHKYNGYIIKQRSVKDIIVAVNVLNNDSELRKKLIDNALKDIKEKYQLSNYDDMAKRLYEETEK